MMYMIVDNKREYLSLQECNSPDRTEIQVVIIYHAYRSDSSQSFALSKAEARRLGKALVKWADTSSFGK